MLESDNCLGLKELVNNTADRYYSIVVIAVGSRATDLFIFASLVLMNCLLLVA